MRARLVLCVGVVLGSSGVARASDPAEITTRLETLTSKSARAKSDVPKLAFTSNLTWDPPASLDEAVFGFPALSRVDRAKTVVGFAGDDTAFISANVGEFSHCPSTGCAASTPETWLRATAVFEKANGIWQPLAWAITPPIPGSDQIQAMAEGIVPDKLTRNVAGAEAPAMLFETTIGDPKLFAATVSTRAETAMFGSEMGERYTGGQVARQLQSWNLIFKVRDGVRAGVSRSGKVAWVAANVDALQNKRPKAKPIPYRMFAIYELVGKDWKLVHLQFSTSV
ncbi:MAG: hypothetical protein JNL83_28345 [Myxococcales bacterium]|nr:hypothetical protein [Myxococcales bacterium]